MKDYKQFIKQLPSSTIVCALGEFNPPTVSHELLVKTVKVVAEQKQCDHVVFLSPSEILNEDKKKQFLKVLFPNNNFVSLGESFFSTVVKKLNENYKNVIIIAGADQFDEFKKLKESTIEVISIGTKEPDADNTKMKQYASKGIYEEFKKLLPSTIREIDGKRLMNEMRIGMGLDPIKEQINLVKDDTREKYFRGEIFNVGQLVESNGQKLEIIKRGSNHLLLKTETGDLVSKWINDVKQINEAVIQPNGTDKIETNSPEAAGNNQPVKPKGKVKGFMTFYNYDDQKKTVNETALNPKDPHGDYKAKSKALQDIQMDPHTHKDPQLKAELIRSKAALEKEYEKHRIKEQTISEEKPEETADRKAQLKRFKDQAAGCKLTEEELEETRRMSAAEKLQRAFKREQEKSAASRKRAQELLAPKQDRPGSGTEFNKTVDPFFKEEFDLSDEEIDKMVESVSDEEIQDLYEEHELTLVYEDTGEEVEHHPEESKIDLLEVLSRQERMRGKIRLRKSAAKRNRSTKIALHRYSDSKTLNKRARRLAIKLIKKRMLRGRDPSKISVGEKERIEKALHSRKDLVTRVASKLAIRVRKTEKSRMSHGKVTKGNMPSVF